MRTTHRHKWYPKLCAGSNDPRARANLVRHSARVPEELASLGAGMFRPNSTCLRFLPSSLNVLRHLSILLFERKLVQRIRSSILRKGDCWHPTLAYFIALQLDRPVFQLTFLFLRGDRSHVARLFKQRVDRSNTSMR